MSHLDVWLTVFGWYLILNLILIVWLILNLMLNLFPIISILHLRALWYDSIDVSFRRHFHQFIFLLASILLVIIFHNYFDLSDGQMSSAHWAFKSVCSPFRQASLMKDMQFMASEWYYFFITLVTGIANYACVNFPGQRGHLRQVFEPISADIALNHSFSGIYCGLFNCSLLMISNQIDDNQGYAYN